MAILVGYVPRAEGRAALRRGAEEAQLRRTKLVVINSNRGGRDLDDKEAAQHEQELAEVRAELDKRGHRARGPPAGPRQRARRRPDRGGRGDRGRLHRHRASPPDAGREADHGQQRPADPARGALPGAGGQGRGGLSRPVSDRLGSRGDPARSVRAVRQRPARDARARGAGRLRVLRHRPALPAHQPDARRHQRCADGRPHRAAPDRRTLARSRSGRRDAPHRGAADPAR